MINSDLDWGHHEEDDLAFSRIAGGKRDRATIEWLASWRLRHDARQRFAQRLLRQKHATVVRACGRIYTVYIQ